MTLPRLLRIALAALSVTGAIATRGADSLPPWAAEIARQPTPEIAGNSEAVVLLDERMIDIATDGSRTTRRRVALRLLRRDGRELARATVPYLRPGDKIPQFEAWLQNPAAPLRRFGRKDVVDIALNPEMLYAETRLAMIDLSLEIAPGGLLAWEATLAEPPTLAQAQVAFQTGAPVAAARCTLRLPKGWTQRALVVNHPQLERAATPGGATWEFHDLPALKDEPFAPNVAPRSAGLLLTYTSPGPSKHAATAAFADWAEIAAFARARFLPALKSTPALRDKARALCEGRTSRWEKTRALAEFVQSLRYVAIAADLHRDGGYTPHAATTVLNWGYGDCKDKSALLCALLAEAGVPAYPVLCFSGDRTAVRPDWPSPLQFNHVFVAIEVDAEAASPFIVSDSQTGGLLLFDPTDPDTTFGDFPLGNQGANVLVCTPTATGLTPVPVAPATANRYLRKTRATVAPNGDAAIELIESGSGGAGAYDRHLFSDLAKKQKTAGDWLAQVMPGARIEQTATVELDHNGDFQLSAKLALPRFAQLLSPGRFVLKPLSGGRPALQQLAEKERTRPLLLSAACHEFDADFELPTAMRPSGAAPTFVEERDFARYELTARFEGNRVHVCRTLELRCIELPAARHGEFRAFLETVRRLDNTAIILEAGAADLHP